MLTPKLQNGDKSSSTSKTSQSFTPIKKDTSGLKIKTVVYTEKDRKTELSKRPTSEFLSMLMESMGSKTPRVSFLNFLMILMCDVVV